MTTEQMKNIVWLRGFKIEFERRTGIKWNEDAGQTDEDAIAAYFPGEFPQAVTQYIEKYNLIDLANKQW